MTYLLKFCFLSSPFFITLHWKNSQISKLGYRLDKSWIFQARINKLVNPKLVFQKIVINFVYHKTLSSFSTKTSLEFTEVILLTKPVF